MDDELNQQEAELLERDEAIREGYQIWSETLPRQIWCRCGHISGHHGVLYPHRCAENGSCKCSKFEAASNT
jgi:hypothetical protein